MPTASKAPRHVFAAAVFDCDGLLIDTRRCWIEAFEKTSGHELDEAVLRELVGSSTRTGAAALSERFGVEIDPGDVEAALVDSLGHVTLEPLPGVVDLLEHLSGTLPLAVATNGPKAFIEAALGRLMAFFEFVMTSEEAGADKPDPAVYFAACKRIGIQPATAVAFEDSAIGARSALAAGISLVVVNETPLVGLESAAILTVPRADDQRLLALLSRGDRA